MNDNVTARIPPGRPAHSMTYTPVDLLDQYHGPDVSGNGTFDVLDFDYNGDRKIRRVTLADLRVADYQYGANGRVSQLTTPNGVATYAYNPTTGKLA